MKILEFANAALALAVSALIFSAGCGREGDSEKKAASPGGSEASAPAPARSAPSRADAGGAAPEPGGDAAARAAALRVRADSGDFRAAREFSRILSSFDAENFAMRMRGENPDAGGRRLALAGVLFAGGRAEEAVYIAEDLAYSGFAPASEMLSKWLRETSGRAESGDAAAAFDLSGYYAAKGRSGESLKWLEKSASAGHAKAMGELYRRKYHNYLEENSSEEAMALLKRAAGLSEPDSMRRLAELTASGKGVKADPKAALDLFRRAAEAGMDQAAEAARFYADSDPALAEEFVKKVFGHALEGGAEGGYYPAAYAFMMLECGVGGLKNPELAESFKSGFVAAYPHYASDFYMACANYYSSDSPFKPDPEKVLENLRMAASSGSDAAGFVLDCLESAGGWRVFDAEGPRSRADLERWLELYRRHGGKTHPNSLLEAYMRHSRPGAESPEFVRAMLEDVGGAMRSYHCRSDAAAWLCALYSEGVTVEKNPDEAERFRRIGEACDYERFCIQMHYIYSSRSFGGVPPDAAKAGEWLWAAAKSGSRYALYSLSESAGRDPVLAEKFGAEFGAENASPEAKFEAAMKAALSGPEGEGAPGARAMMESAAKSGSRKAMSVLYFMFARGFCGPADPVRAEYWRSAVMSEIERMGGDADGSAEEFARPFSRYAVLSSANFGGEIEILEALVKAGSQNSGRALAHALVRRGDAAGAERALRASAAGGDSLSMMELAELLEKNGDVRGAADFYKRGVEGDPVSNPSWGIVRYLAFCRRNGLEEDALAFALSRPGIPVAAYAAAEFLERGIGAPADAARAESLRRAPFENPSEMPDAEAVEIAIDALLEGKAATESPRRAFELAGVLAESYASPGRLAAMMIEGRGCERDIPGAIALLERFPNDAATGPLLAGAYMAESPARSFDRAADACEAHIESGLCDASDDCMTNLAVLKLCGYGSSPSAAGALRLLEASRDSGNMRAKARECLAYCFENGIGVRRDAARAAEMRAGAKSGAEGGGRFAAELYFQFAGATPPVFESPKRAMEILQAACDAGDSAAGAELETVRRAATARELSRKMSSGREERRARALQKIRGIERSPARGTPGAELEISRILLDAGEYEAGAVRLIKNVTKGDAPSAMEIAERFSAWSSAFEAGGADAALALGYAHMYGFGTEKNDALAVSYFERALEAGKPEAAMALYELLKISAPGEAAERAREFASRGIRDFAYMAAMEVLEGGSAGGRRRPFDRSIPASDTARGFAMMERAAGLGSEKAALHICDASYVYDPEKFYGENADRAQIRRYRNPARMFAHAAAFAARLDTAKLWKNLAMYYLNGIWVEKNPERAFESFSRASRLGEKSANAYLAAMLRAGVGTPKNPAEAARLEGELERASDGEIARAAYAYLGFENGGFLPDLEPENIAKWMRFGAGLGIDYCRRRLPYAEEMLRKRLREKKGSAAAADGRAWAGDFAYVWRRAWDGDASSAVGAAGAWLSGVNFLGGSVSFEGGRPVFSKCMFDAAALTGFGRRKAVSIRIEDPRADGAEYVALGGAVAEAVGRACGEILGAVPGVSELQLDFDCPESKIGFYAGWMEKIRGAIPGGMKLTFTAVPSQMKSPDFARLASLADGFVVQVHNLAERGGGYAVFDRASALRAARGAAAFGRPFHVALPTYSHAAVFGPDGRMRRVYSENFAPGLAGPGESVKVYASGAREVAGLAREIRAAGLENFEGIAWFRLPCGRELTNWSMAAFMNVVCGADSRPDGFRVGLRDSGGGLFEVFVENRGPFDIVSPASFFASAENAAAFDAIAGFAARRTPSGVEFSAGEGAFFRLEPSASAKIGWIRVRGL